LDNRKSSTFRHSLYLLGTLTVMSAVLPAGSASAQGLLELLFGGFRRSAPPAAAQAYADPGSGERGETRGERGASVGYCVRLCDGQPFPIQRNAGATPIQVCNAFCPASKTKAFSGSSIDRAVASDGSRYADLDNAFVYRQKLVPNCTCNGKTAGGLATLDVNTDPTLHAGDIVATNSGLLAVKDTRKGSAEFTPLSSEASRKLADVKVTPGSKPATQTTPISSAPGSDEDRRAQLSR
jgi:hypothetical protein